MITLTPTLHPLAMSSTLDLLWEMIENVAPLVNLAALNPQRFEAQHTALARMETAGELPILRCGDPKPPRGSKRGPKSPMAGGY